MTIYSELINIYFHCCSLLNSFYIPKNDETRCGVTNNYMRDEKQRYKVQGLFHTNPLTRIICCRKISVTLYVIKHLDHKILRHVVYLSSKEDIS